MLQSLPVIVGFGGYNAAGRSSSHQSFRRMVLESLPVEEQQNTVVALACLMALVHKTDHGYTAVDGDVLSPTEVDTRFRKAILDGTLVRKTELFDPFKVPGHKRIAFDCDDQSNVVFSMQKRDLPSTLPADWQITDVDNGRVSVTATAASSYLIESHYDLISKASGQLPSGFEPSAHYASRFHPRGLQMALVGASDALHSTGLAWQAIVDRVRPDEVGVYSSSALSQVTEEGFGGLMQGRLRGNRTTAKQLPLGLNTMPADFINSRRYKADSEKYLSLLKMPWPHTERHLRKIDSRSRYYPERFTSPRLPDVFYLDLKREHKACDTLRHISYALELSKEKGYPVVQQLHAPMSADGLGTDYHTVRLPRVMTNSNTVGEQYFDWEPNSFRERGTKRSYDGGIIKVLPLSKHPLYPSTQKSEMTSRFDLRLRNL